MDDVKEFKKAYSQKVGKNAGECMLLSYILNVSKSYSYLRAH